MSFKIQLCSQTRQALRAKRQQAYATGDVRLVRRSTVLLEVLGQRQPVLEAATQWQIGPATIYQWVVALLQTGVASLTPHWGGGRPAKLTPGQKAQLCQLLDAGPAAAGFDTACWSSVLVAQLIQREFGVLYNRFYVCQLLKNLGYSFQKAQFVSDHLDPERRQQWLDETWPQLLAAAQRCGAKILFGDECSFAQWGSLSYTWARKGHTPVVPTSGKRHACKVYGLIEFFTGQVFYRVSEGRFNSQSYCAFLEAVLGQTQGPLFLIQDGARYHTSAATRQFCEAHQSRLTVYQLPSYSPDYNPIEYLWRKAKKAATHNRYLAQFEALTQAVEQTLAALAQAPQAVRQLFGRYLPEAFGTQPELKLAA
jgi:transposase